MFAHPLTADAELRPLQPWHAAEFAEHRERAYEHISPWVGAGFANDEAGLVLQRYADKYAKDAGGIWGIWLDGRLVGGVLLVSFDLKSGVSEAGCWLEPSAVGRGLITRAATVLLDWVILDRGIERVEWHTNARNAPSIAVAKRLGMSLDGTMRSAFPSASGERGDMEVWSVLAAEWRAHRAVADEDKAAVDALTAKFFALFTNTEGAVPDVSRIHDLFVPNGVISNGGPKAALYDLDAFAAPRQALLTSGDLTDFAEWETWERTTFFGDVAHRLGGYRKQGVLRGAPFTGGGNKSMQFLRTPDGWRLTSVSWDDERPPTP
ncbi:MAG: GNAT family N-acetyltransferase [Hamadaea sp.]|nr:GNAT family N-acetyltransferase [Hamadaea sp.]NUR51516.1 GNAT family N-acetyltransferase [Hamadaea sp.]NUT08490.1 GNAT family N-acetyltransferase [Hamadaea sp.]